MSTAQSSKKTRKRRAKVALPPGGHPVLDRTPNLRAKVDRHGFSSPDAEWLGWHQPHTFCCTQGHVLQLPPLRVITHGFRGCSICNKQAHLQRLHREAEAAGVRCLETEWAGEKALYRFACPKGHEWYRDAAADIHCRQCVKNATTLAKRDANGLQRLQQAAQAQGGECLSGTYLGTAARYHFRCAEGHEWEARGAAVLLRAWCRPCSDENRRLENRPTDADEGLMRLRTAAQAKGGVCLAERYLGTAARYAFRCAEGHQWDTPGNLVLRGSWCRRCVWRERSADKRRLGALQQLQTLAAEKGGECLSTEYKGLNYPVRFRCAKGHEWEARADGPLRGKWCRFCQADAKRLSIDDARAAAAARGGSCLSDLYTDCQTKLTWMCDRGHVWQARLGNVRNGGTWCPECAHMAKLSNPKSKARRRYAAAGAVPDVNASASAASGGTVRKASKKVLA